MYSTGQIKYDLPQVAIGLHPSKHIVSWKYYVEMHLIHLILLDIIA